MVRVPAEGLQSPKGHQIPSKLDESFTFSLTHSLTHSRLYSDYNWVKRLQIADNDLHLSQQPPPPHLPRLTGASTRASKVGWLPCPGNCMSHCRRLGPGQKTPRVTINTFTPLFCKHPSFSLGGAAYLRNQFQEHRCMVTTVTTVCRAPLP